MNKVKAILEQYGFSKKKIEEIIEGDRIYQLELLYENGAARVVFERIDAIISFLFLDPNHHIYFNKNKVNSAHSLYYEYCPEQLKGECKFFNNYGDCYIDEYLDINKFYETFNNKFNPENKD